MDDWWWWVCASCGRISEEGDGNWLTMQQFET
jgi:hypothetical protein